MASASPNAADGCSSACVKDIITSPPGDSPQLYFFHAKPARNKWTWLISEILRNRAATDIVDEHLEATSSECKLPAAERAATRGEDSSAAKERGSSGVSSLLFRHGTAAEAPTVGNAGRSAVVAQLCDDVRDVLASEPVVLGLDLAETDRLVIVGDIHGQLQDVLSHVFSIQMDRAFDTLVSAASCSESTVPSGAEAPAAQVEPYDVKYLFLGDYVDRGPKSVEVIMLLLALKIEYPQLVHLLRGNHEEAKTSRMYGFLEECRGKLDMRSWQLFNAIFCLLPLAAAVTCPSGSFFCVHGGLSPEIFTIAGMQALHRADYGQVIAGNDESDTIDGLLWSDPSEIHTGFRANARGCGFTFGEDATANFCNSNNMQFIVRAHQLVLDGFEWNHSHRVLTLFSAPNYCGFNQNKGAIALLDCASQVGKDRVELHLRDFSAVEATDAHVNEASVPLASGTTSHLFSHYFGSEGLASKP